MRTCLAKNTSVYSIHCIRIRMYMNMSYYLCLTNNFGKGHRFGRNKIKSKYMYTQQIPIKYIHSKYQYHIYLFTASEDGRRPWFGVWRGWWSTIPQLEESGDTWWGLFDSFGKGEVHHQVAVHLQLQRQWWVGWGVSWSTCAAPQPSLSMCLPSTSFSWSTRSIL